MCSACRTVTEDADLMTSLRMRVYQIAHMPKDAADGRPEAVNDAERS